MKRRLLAAAMAVFFFSSSVVANSSVFSPYVVGKTAKTVDFYGNFTPSGARQEIHRANYGEWEYHVVKSTKERVSKGYVPSFTLLENNGEDFESKTGYSMIYLPTKDNDPNESVTKAQRINKIKQLAKQYNGNEEYVSQVVEGLVSDFFNGTQRNEIYYSQENPDVYHLWIGAGQLAYYAGATDSLDKQGDKCGDYIGLTCGSSEEIKAAGESPPLDSKGNKTGRAMLIATPYPSITTFGVYQNGKPVTTVDSSQEFQVQTLFTAYGGWGTNGYATVTLNGTKLPITTGADPYTIQMNMAESFGRDGDFGYKYSFLRGLSPYKQYLQQGQNTLTVTVTDSYQRNTVKTITFNYGGVATCQPLLSLASENAKTSIAFPEGVNVAIDDYVNWGLEYDPDRCVIHDQTTLTSQEYYAAGEGSIGKPYKVSGENKYVAYYNQWQFKLRKVTGGIEITNISTDSKPLVAYLKKEGSNKKIDTVVISKGQKTTISLPSLDYSGNYYLSFPTPYEHNGFWKNAETTFSGHPATLNYPSDLTKKITQLISMPTGER